MIIITDHKQLSTQFSKLCDYYGHYKWAIAWAGKEAGFDLARILRNNKNKLDRLIVGLHFFQTDPLFIEHYMNNPAVRFIKQTDGIFHPKVYFFYNSPNDWTAIVGSANFTFSAFTKNSEASILFDQDDGEDLFEQLSQYVESIWAEADSFSSWDLDSYKSLYNYQKPHLDSLCKSIVNKGSNRIESSGIDVMTWDSYMSSIFQKSSESIPDRIRILNKAHNLFSKYSSFNDIPLAQRKCLAGFAREMNEDDDVDWFLFGSMRGAGLYENAVITGSATAKAIDIIPLHGAITEKQFRQYCNVFKLESKNPLASATRLLALKRPDTFVCIDSRNIKNLCKAFRIHRSHLTIDSYWELIVERVKKTMWYREKGGEKNKRIKKYQVAMLDCLFYEKKR